jgi:hypothetical protein
MDGGVFFSRPFASFLWARRSIAKPFQNPPFGTAAAVLDDSAVTPSNRVGWPFCWVAIAPWHMRPTLFWGFGHGIQKI